MIKMKNKLKRVVSLCLVLMLVVTFVQVSVPVKADAADTAEAAEAADMTDMTVDAATDATDTADTVDTTDTTEAVDKADITEVTDEADTADAVDAMDTTDTTDKANTADLADTISDVVDAADTTDLDVTINYAGRQVQTWTAPYSGYYYVEAYGAAGGNDGCRGGYGGYVKMYTYLNKGTNLYITCGQKGWGHCSIPYKPDTGEKLDDNPAYNGGARASNSHGSSGVGGGATSIALSNHGELKDFANCKNDVLMVAGGGAGGSNHSSGVGGLVLYTGSSTNYSVMNGADISLLNGQFALGSPPVNDADGGGGGGGWIGGKSGLDAAGNSAGGGASFVNTSQRCIPIELVPDYNTKDGYVHITSTDYTEYYTISYDYDGGTASNPISYSVTQDDFTLAKPTKEGYTFTGWTGSNGDIPQKDVTIKKGTAKNLSFKANWTINYYTLDLNSEVDGECLTYLPDGCTCDLYINGQLEAAGINDIFKQYPYGTTYEFKNFKTGINLVYANKVQSVYHDSEGNLDENCQPLKGTVKAYLNSSKYGGMTHVVPIFNTKSVNVTFHRNTSSSDTQTASQTFIYGVAGQSFSDKGWSYAGHTLLGWAYSNNATEAYHTPLNGVLDSWINTEYPKVDLYAVWSTNRYTVTYDANGGTNAPAAQSFLYNSGEKLSTQVPVRTGYKFMGWRLGTTVYNPGDSIPSGTMNLNLKAMWIINSYQVAFNGNGSTNGVMESECFNYDESKALNKNAYSKDGYSFKNWNTKADGSGTSYSDEQIISKLVNGENITASINPMETFTVGGKGMRYDGLEEDNSLTTGIAYKATYTTTGISSMGFFSKPYDNAIANNKLAGKRIIVTFKAKASNPMQLKTVGLENISLRIISLGTSWNTYYFTGTIPDNWITMSHAMVFYDPSVVGTVYVGDMSVSIVEPVNLYAQWTANTHKNRFWHFVQGFKNAEGNSTNKQAYKVKEDSSVSFTYGQSYTIDESYATQIPNGCYLDSSFGSSWHVGTNGIWEPGDWLNYKMGTTIMQADGSMFFEYDYYPYDYTITYNLNGGTNNNANPSTYTVLYGVTLKNPTRAGYTFIGWYDEKGNKVTGINEGCNAIFSSSEDLYAKLAKRTTGNKTLTARWEPIHYTVKYDANGGTGTMASQDITYTDIYDNMTNTTKCQYTKNGYLFDGWYASRMYNGKLQYLYASSSSGRGEWYDEGHQPSGYSLYKYSNGEKTGHVTTVDKDVITFHAQWQINKYDLSVTHTVLGNMGNKCSDFSFTLNLSGMSGNSVTAVFTDVSGKQITKTLSMNNGKVAFTLKHGESIVFKGIPYNTPYTITENNADGYTVTSSNASGTITGNTTATFTSTRNATVPTSADTNATAMVVIAGLSIIVAIMLILKRRKTNTK